MALPQGRLGNDWAEMWSVIGIQNVSPLQQTAVLVEGSQRPLSAAVGCRRWHTNWVKLLLRFFRGDPMQRTLYKKTTKSYFYRMGSF